MQQTFAQQLLKAQIETQEETFHAIGRDLHDNIGQLLNSAKLLIGITQRQLNTTVPDTLHIADETLSNAIQELRNVSKSLNKDWLQQFNLIENLQSEVQRINATDTLQITFIHPKILPISSDKQVMLFRVIQEAVQNAIKHASATTIDIEISVSDNDVQIHIQDNGVGFNTASKKQSGVGLLNMKHRIQLLKGNIEWLSMLNGTKVQIALPINEL
ncbi:MAG: sensor histidine kinase [Chitinophagaceae bacterium]